MTALALALAVTACIETGIAALLGLRRRALGAVASVNLVTNPLVNLCFWALCGLGAVFCLLEVMVVIAEWRALVWVLGGRTGAASRRLLVICVAMNAVSATLGTYLLMPIAST